MSPFEGGGQASSSLSVHNQLVPHLGGQVSAILSVDGVPQLTKAAFVPRPSDIIGQRSAFIRCDDCTLDAIISAADANYYAVDPSPDVVGRYVWRHPVYLVGEPKGIGIHDARRIVHTKFPYVSADAPR